MEEFPLAVLGRREKEGVGSEGKLETVKKAGDGAESSVGWSSEGSFCVLLASSSLTLEWASIEAE